MIRPEQHRFTWRKSSHSQASNECVEVGGFWRKSSYSQDSNACVEIGGQWRKSSHSQDSNECVEVAVTSATVAVRDSKHPTGPTLALPAVPWTTFLATLV